MPQVSRVKLNKKTENKLTETLTLILSKVSMDSDMNVFLAALLTPTEKLMLAKRIAIVVLLKENLSDTQISSVLNVTRITVAKMRYFLEARGQGYDVAIRVLENQKLIDELKSVLVKLAGYSFRSAGGRVKPGIV